MKPIIIIGSGLAGYTLAKEFRKVNTDQPLMIITQSEGHFYSKPLLSTALSFKRKPEDLAVADANTMAKQLNADILTQTQVTAIHPIEQKVLINDQSIAYSKLVLASGAEVIRAPITGSGVSDIHSVNDLEDYVTFRDSLQGKKSIAILGAGLVGCEFANDLVNSGYPVDIIALSRYPADRFLPEALGHVLIKALSDEGVKWHLEQVVLSVDKLQEGYLLTLTQGTQLKADIVLSAIGLRPRVHLASQAGLKVNRGIMVNNYLETSHRHIYALGDCAEVNGLSLLFIAPILHCARALSKTLNGEKTAVSYPVMPITLKTPACPIVVCPPPVGIDGRWIIEGESLNIKASFIDNRGQLKGFALSGKTVKERLSMTQLIEE